MQSAQCAAAGIRARPRVVVCRPPKAAQEAYTQSSLPTYASLRSSSADRPPGRRGHPSTSRPARTRSLQMDGKEIAMAPMNGTIKRLVSEKGFGFILASDGNEYFFHNSACAETRFDDLREGQAVTFERGQGPKGPRGENVKVA